MREGSRILGFGVAAPAALVVALAVWLHAAPPALIRLGAAYTAKTVCSNVFIAGREAAQVLETDVQAPGHPLLKLMRVRVDAEAAVVRAGLFGVFGDGLALYRGGTGCVAVADGDLERAEGPGFDVPAVADATGPWPNGPEDAPAGGAAVDEILADAALTGPGMRAVVVVRDGRLVGERYGPDVETPDQPLAGWSMTKTVTAAIIGTLVRDGRLAVEDRDLFAQWAGDARAEITIADLLGMESGLAFNEEYGNVTDVTRMLYLEADMSAFAAAMPLEAPTGGRFHYSSGTSVLLSRVWQNALAAPQDALAWPYEALFGPLGMKSALLETDARGTFVGSSSMYATARDWARFGQLLLQDGVWQGERILPEGWVAWMRRPTAASKGEYGRHVWLHGPGGDAGFDLPPDTFWLIGHDGQSIAIVPSRRLLVVRLGLTPSSAGYKPQGLVEALANLPGRPE